MPIHFCFVSFVVKSRGTDSQTREAYVSVNWHLQNANNRTTVFHIKNTNTLGEIHVGFGIVDFFLFGAPHAAIRKQGELKPKGKERDI